MLARSPSSHDRADKCDDVGAQFLFIEPHASFRIFCLREATSKDHAAAGDWIGEIFAARRYDRIDRIAEKRSVGRNLIRPIRGIKSGKPRRSSGSIRPAVSK